MLRPLTHLSVLASHQTGDGNLAILWVFLGVLATAGWLIFSEMKWRNTLAITALGWLLILGLIFVL